MADTATPRAPGRNQKGSGSGGRGRGGENRGRNDRDEVMTSLISLYILIAYQK